MQRCCTCKEFKPSDAFSPAYRGKRSAPCRACKQARKDRSREEFTWEITRETEERFWSHVEFDAIGTGCLAWKNYKNSYGYGQFYINGRQLGAHRIALKLAGRHPPKWPVVVDHLCKNRACVNVAHMRIVTQRINSLENNTSPHAANAAKTHCAVCGTPFAGKNLAVKWVHPRKKAKYLGRICLTCYPSNWRHALIQRAGPPRARTKWVGPPPEWKP